MNFLKSVIKLVYNPKSSFEDLKTEPSIKRSFALYIFLYIIIVLIQWGLISKGVKSTALEQNIDVAGSKLFFVMFSSLISSLLVLVSTPLIKGFFVQAIIQLFKVQKSLKLTIAVITRSYFVVLLGELILTPAKLFFENSSFKLSLNLFFKSPNVSSPIFSVLAMLDLFTIWYLFLSIYGLIKVHNIKLSEASISILAPFFILLATIFIPVN
jgi:hypothetical protein